jgi:[ribosomal protein S5]-alanine N-acetyltransferase
MPTHSPCLPEEGLPVTEGVRLRAIRAADAPMLLRYYDENRAHLRPWEPLRGEGFYTLDAMHTRIDGMLRSQDAQTALHLILERTGSSEMVGECSFTNIVRGPFQACHLGFSLDARAEGRGLMSSALRIGIAYVFDVLRLHRIMANHRPENTRSAALLARLGFEREGLARRYLKIDGAWADHVLTSLLNPSDRD